MGLYEPTPYEKLPQLTKTWDGCTVTKDGQVFVRKHIRYSEIECKCGRYACKRVNWALVIHPGILGFFQDLREDFGAPIYINSGCRCGQHQADLTEAHKATISPHVPVLQKNGRWRTFALDLVPSDYDVDSLYERTKRIEATIRRGALVYNWSLLHVDNAYVCEPNPKPQDWRAGATW